MALGSRHPAPGPAHPPPAAVAERRVLTPGRRSSSGWEWVVDAHGCDAARLASPAALAGLFAAMIAELRLKPVAPAVWHQFPGPAGITGVCLLAESHLTVHTFPEHRSLCLNLFCCTPRPEWDFEGELARRVGAERVEVRRLGRDYEDGVRSAECGPSASVDPQSALRAPQSSS